MLKIGLNYKFFTQSKLYKCIDQSIYDKYIQNEPTIREGERR